MVLMGKAGINLLVPTLNAMFTVQSNNLSTLIFQDKENAAQDYALEELRLKEKFKTLSDYFTTKLRELEAHLENVNKVCLYNCA